MAGEDDVRRVARSLPETTETPCYGALGVRVEGHLLGG
jgi:hypothetical protein